MYFQFNVEPTVSTSTESTPTSPAVPEAVELLRQILEVQREQLSHLRASTTAHDIGARWRAFLSRWQQDFPDLADDCRKCLPILERCYGKLIADLTDKLCQDGEDALDNDFALQDFLDRYGMRLAQLGSILNLVAPLAEAGQPGQQGEST